jgi:hypothetical protein
MSDVRDIRARMSDETIEGVIDLAIFPRAQSRAHLARIADA